MSRHEGVSCDSCLKSNFSGRRYKCLICYDYDLCADCYEEGATSTRHSVDHPMQCILTRSDIELYFGGEMLSSEQPQSFTCPYCKKMGFSDSTLLEHVTSEHTDTGLEVVCPVCAGLPGGEPNLVTDDFAGHLTLEHRTGPRDLISFLDEPSAIRHGGVRRISGRALAGPRSRRSNMHFSSSSGLSALSPSGRESVDPIAELLSQLSGVRRGTPQNSQLQQLQIQMQMERQQAGRQQLERLPRRQPHHMVTSNSNVAMQEVITSSSGIGSNAPVLVSSGSGQHPQASMAVASLNSGSAQLTVTNLSTGGFQSILGGVNLTSNSTINSINGNESQSQFLLTKFMCPMLSEPELEKLEKDRADRSQYVQALMLSTFSNMQLECKKNTDTDQRAESEDTQNSDNVNNDEINENFDERGKFKDDKHVKGSLGGGAGGENVEQFGDVEPQQQHRYNQVNQQQQTSPEDFLDEYQLQQQTYNSNSVCKKKLPIAGKSTTSSSSATGNTDRRSRPVPLPSGAHALQHTAQQQQQNSVKMARDLKAAATAATKEIPDSR